MRRIVLLLILLSLVTSTGCKGSDVLFGLFGEHYTNGTTLDDKRAHYDADVAKYQNSTNR